MVNDIALCNMGVRAGKSTHNTRIEQTTVSERKDFRFCICVCRCPSHVSSGYETQFVFSDACFLRVLWSRCVFLMSLMLFQSGKSYASESYAASQSSVCGSYGILRRLAMTDSLVARVSDIQSRSPQAPCCHTAICRTCLATLARRSH